MIEFSGHESLGQSGIQQKERNSCHNCGISRNGLYLVYYGMIGSGKPGSGVSPTGNYVGLFEGQPKGELWMIFTNTNLPFKLSEEGRIFRKQL